MAIDWTDPKSRLTTYFTVKEALWLPTWNRMANEKDGLGQTQKDNLLKLMKVMDAIRIFINAPVAVHVTFRSYSYNKLIGGAPKSAHVQGMACDFSVPGTDCDKIRKLLLPRLESLGVRMEDLPGSSWVHIDTKLVPEGGTRFFKP